MSDRINDLRYILESYIQNRRDGVVKTAKLKKKPKKEINEIKEKYTIKNIVSKGFNGINSTIIATHIAKYTHPNLGINDVTNLNITNLNNRLEVGSHCIRDNDIKFDVTGNGAVNGIVYELCLLLNIEFEGISIGNLILKNDVDVLSVLFDGITEEKIHLNVKNYKKFLERGTKEYGVAEQSKQVYWSNDNENHLNNDHLLVPLTSSVLLNKIYTTIEYDRFDQKSSDARLAHKKNEYYDGIHKVYHDIGILPYGGNKPQNVSYLNSIRAGKSYLLSSSPPQLKYNPQKIKIPYTESIFDKIFSNRYEVYIQINNFIKFLKTNPKPNKATREKVKSYVYILLDELFEIENEYINNFDAGWTKGDKIILDRDEQLWLDPNRAKLEGEEDFKEEYKSKVWKVKIGDKFARWLNSKLEDTISVGDKEFHNWNQKFMRRWYNKNSLRSI